MNVLASPSLRFLKKTCHVANRLAVFALTLVLFASANDAHAQPREKAPLAPPQLTKAPSLAAFVEAVLPEGAVVPPEGAVVVIEISLDAQGAVAEARVATGVGEPLDSAALVAVKQFRFEPAEIDGKPAAVRLRYNYEYAPPPPVPTYAVLRGVIVDQANGAPLAGISVELDGGRAVVTDERGEFRFEGLEPGPHAVQIFGERLLRTGTEETLVAGEELEARYEVAVEPLAPPAAAPSDEDDLSLDVVAPRLRKQVASTTVEATQARRVAGTQGDVIKIVQNLPGVARAAAGSGDTVVWGASPEDTRVYINALRIPALYHFGGLRSVVNSDLVGSVELIPGGYRAEYGRGLGGLILLGLKEATAVPEAQLHGSLSVDPLDASASLRVSTKQGWHVAAAGRRSHLLALAKAIGKDEFAEFFVVPSYWDGQVRVVYAPKDNESVELLGLASSDEQERNRQSSDPNQRALERRALSFNRLSLRWQKRDAEGSNVSLQPWIGLTRRVRSGNVGGVPSELAVRALSYGAAATWDTPLVSDVRLNTGLDLDFTSARVVHSGSTVLPPREGDAYIFGRVPSDQVSADETRVNYGSAAAFAEIDAGLFDKRVHVVPGVRLEPFLTSVDRRRPREGDSPASGAWQTEFTVQPRLALSYAPDPRVTFRGAYGSYRQSPAPEDLSAVFGTPVLPIASAEHVLVGAEVQVVPWLFAKATGFYTRSRGLAVRSAAPSPLVAEALVPEGTGRTVGVELLLRADPTGGFFGWIAYTLSRSERRDGSSTPTRLFDYDQTHVLTALGSYDLGAEFDIGLRVRVASGFPRTAVDGHFYDALRDRYEPILGAKNEIRLPLFVQLDARAAKRFAIGATELEVYLDVQNVTNRANAEEFAYSADYLERQVISGLPILPLIGAEWRF